jgi:YHS domain-containing protein
MSHFTRYLWIFLVLFAVSVPLSPPVNAADTNTAATVLNAPPPKEIGAATKCAVCGMKLHVKKDTPAVEYKGKDYYFCDDAERDAFAKDPEQFLKK